VKHSLLRGAAVLAAGTSVLAGTATSAGATEHGGDPHNSGITVVADNLNNPRQIAVHDGAVYVAEAGTGGVSPAPDVPGTGFTGSVTRVRDGHAQRVQTGLLSISATSPGGTTEVVGVDALAFRGDQLYGIASGGCPKPGVAVPPEALAQAGKVLRLDGGTDVEAVGDASTIECTTDPDGQDPDTDPYGLAIRGRTFYVADAAGNDVVKIRRGETTVAKVLPTTKTKQPVPTSLAFGPDGGLYIGTLAFWAGPGGAKVYRLDVHSGELSVYAEGLSAITGIAFDGRGNLFVSEFTSSPFGMTGPNSDGDVVVVPPGGGSEGRQVLGTGALHNPGGVGVDRHGVYVSNWSILPGADTTLGEGNHGQLVRIAFDAGRDHGRRGDVGDDEYDCSRSNQD
jgi:hypothetical protein